MMNIFEKGDNFYEEKHAKQREEAAKQPKFAPTPLSAVFKSVEECNAERDRQIAENDASPYSQQSYTARGQGLHLPPSDPILLRRKWETLRKGEAYPGDDEAGRRLGHRR